MSKKNRSPLLPCRCCGRQFRRAAGKNSPGREMCCTVACLIKVGPVKVTNKDNVQVTVIPPKPPVKPKVAAQYNPKRAAKIERRKKRRLSRRGGFYDSPAWRKIRYAVIERDGRVCACCRETTGTMHVDHIIPRAISPELSLEITNLQVLCKACNLGKGANYSTDWRKINQEQKPAVILRRANNSVDTSLDAPDNK